MIFVVWAKSGAVACCELCVKVFAAYVANGLGVVDIPGNVSFSECYYGGVGGECVLKACLKFLPFGFRIVNAIDVLIYDF